MTQQRRVCLILLTCFLLGLGLAATMLSVRESEATPLRRATGCVELLQDGGFEAGGQGWLQYSAQGYALISDFNPRTGSLGAYLAGVNNADDRLSQQVLLPSADTALTLHAWWGLATAETAGAFDTMTASLLRLDGSPLASLITVDSGAPVNVWEELVFDLVPYAGQTVVLQFEARTDANNISDFYLDDISIVACAADPQPTATATATQTPPTTTATAAATVTASPTVTLSVTPTPTLTATPTATPDVTPTPTVTATPPPTATPERDPRRSYLPYIIK